ncbi:hypothetical protein L6452_15209 [Arctium lappa]|uniref:Uncharacterized protein n=1 Tax=Arctium lappa TaxID=4217 RepID=A0ACB9CN88_ARCLA|nr:hypothetical protein L6452_15209 [Arctium lappa]
MMGDAMIAEATTSFQDVARVLHDDKVEHTLDMHGNNSARISPSVENMQSDAHGADQTQELRRSVFDRLSGELLGEVSRLNTELEYGKVDILKKNFAEAVGGSAPSSLKFYHLEDKKKSVVSIPIELAKEVAKGTGVATDIPHPIPLISVVIKTFRTYDKPRRGPPLHSMDGENRFEVLGDENLMDGDDDCRMKKGNVLETNAPMLESDNQIHKG